MINTGCQPDFISNDKKIAANEKKTLLVAILTLLTMVVEIIAGYMTGSMALLADGWHMASHAGALGIAVLAYRVAKSEKFARKLNFGAGKLIPLGGYTSAIALVLIALIMTAESIVRLLNPQVIVFNEALIVAVAGLVVNLVSAFLLQDDHDHGHTHHACAEGHDHSHSHDHNLKAAYMHVVADAMTSVLAIAALLVGKFYGLVWMDPLMGILGAALILKWSFHLIRETGFELLDAVAPHDVMSRVLKCMQNEKAEVRDVHLWRIAPQAFACEIVLFANPWRGTSHYRKILTDEMGLGHVVIEQAEV